MEIGRETCALPICPTCRRSWRPCWWRWCWCSGRKACSPERRADGGGEAPLACAAWRSEERRVLFRSAQPVEDPGDPAGGAGAGVPAGRPVRRKDALMAAARHRSLALHGDRKRDVCSSDLPNLSKILATLLVALVLVFRPEGLFAGKTR